MQDPKHDEKDHIKNYSGEDAVKKLKELAEKARTCMFVTLTETRPLPARPMALQGIDDNGILYFFSTATSNKNYEIQNDPHVQLFFENNGHSEYLSVYGKAVISRDRDKIGQLWTPMAKAWFHDGPDDPDLTLISVTPEDCSYWDTKHNRMVALLKIAVSMATGKTMDDGVEGKLEVG